MAWSASLLIRVESYLTRSVEYQITKKDIVRQTVHHFGKSNQTLPSCSGTHKLLTNQREDVNPCCLSLWNWNERVYIQESRGEEEANNSWFSSANDNRALILSNLLYLSSPLSTTTNFEETFQATARRRRLQGCRLYHVCKHVKWIGR